MRTIKSLLAGFLLMTSLCVSAADYTVNNNYVTIPVKTALADGAKTVRLQVVNSKIIRVEATAASSFPEKKSLIILPQPAFSNFKVSETGSDVTVKTDDVTAIVNANTGHVKFFDNSGKLLLDEIADGKGKVFKPYTVPEREIGVDSHLTEAQKHGWTWTATFESPDDEAFFGLGQHQSEELNMKGRNADLFQYNTKISIPFVVGAVIGGGLFGDQCSPISDTTVLSSTGASCNHIVHVMTQIPYGITVGISAFVGFLFGGLTGQYVLSIAVTAAILTVSLITLTQLTKRRYPEKVH